MKRDGASKQTHGAEEKDTKIKEGNSSLGEEREGRTSWRIRSWGQGTQECMGVMEKEAELGCAKAHHEEVGVVPGNKIPSKTDKSGIRASDENMSRYDSMTAKGA